MTHNEIIEMAVKAGIGQVVAEVNIDIMDAFATLVAAKEREACAKVCEEHPDGLNMLGGAYVACAQAIRARGERLSTATGFIGVR